MADAAPTPPSQHEPAPPSNGAALPGARLALGLLLAINLLNYVDRYVLAAVVPKIRDEFQKHDPTLNNTRLGWLGSAFFVSYMVCAPVFGWLADRMSRWLLVAVGVLLWSVATGGSGMAGTFAVLLVCRLFVGVGEAGYGPAAPTLISDLFPVARRGTVLAWFYVAIPVGSAMGFAVGLITSAHLGWRWAFYVVTVPGLVLGACSLFMRDPPRGGSDHATGTGRPGLAQYLRLGRNRSYVLNTAAMAAMTFAIGGISFWMPLYLTKVRGVSEGQVGTWFPAVLVVGGLAATLTGGWLGDRLRRRFGGAYFLVSGAGMLLACPFLLLMLRTPFPACWAVLFLAIFFLFFNTGPSNTALANVVHPTVRATAFALNIFLIHLLGDAPASSALGWVSDHYGWPATFTAVAAVMALAGVLWLAGAPHLAADTDAAPRGA
jgi:MFS family permease